MKTWLMTIPTREVSKRELLFRLRRRAKRWQFGIELGTHSGYEHYQVRYECSNGDYEVERTYWQDIKCELQEAGGWSEYERKDGNFYQSLDDSMGKYRFGKLKELQFAILSHGRKQGDRRITLVIDKNGGTGKTFLARMRDLNGQGFYIDGTDTGHIIRDLLDVCEHHGENRKYTFFIDLSRVDKVSGQLLGRLETVKNGYLKDGRYQYRHMWIYPPQIFVFANAEPKDWNGLSKDRWDKIFIKGDGNGHVTMWDKFEDVARNHISRKRVFPS